MRALCPCRSWRCQQSILGFLVIPCAGELQDQCLPQGFSQTSMVLVSFRQFGSNQRWIGDELLFICMYCYAAAVLYCQSIADSSGTGEKCQNLEKSGETLTYNRVVLRFWAGLDVNKGIPWRAKKRLHNLGKTQKICLLTSLIKSMKNSQSVTTLK